MKIRKGLKRLLTPILHKLDFILDYRYDYLRYCNHSMKNGVPRNDQQLKFRLLQRAHSFEKALSISNIRPLFGKEKLRELVRLIRQYENSQLSIDGIEYQKAIKAYSSYLKFHQQLSIDIHQAFDFLSNFDYKYAGIGGGSVEPIYSEDIKRRAKADFEQLAFSRFSARQFSAEPVDISLIQEAVRIAQKSPSVCNRQSAHAFLIENETLKQEALKIQAGNAGFGDEINKVLIITASLECFDGPKERNQGYIDGGLFAMSLMYALHYKGLATCPLNWSSGRKKDQRLRQYVPIPESHNIIMLLGIGHHKEKYNVAASPRRASEEVFSILT